MVSLLYLPRLFVYHSSILNTSSFHNLFLIMEIGLIKIIATRGMIPTFLFGIILLNLQNDLPYEKYFIIKLIFLLLFVIYQVYLLYIYLVFTGRKSKETENFIS